MRRRRLYLLLAIASVAIFLPASAAISETEVERSIDAYVAPSPEHGYVGLHGPDELKRPGGNYSSVTLFVITNNIEQRMAVTVTIDRELGTGPEFDAVNVRDDRLRPGEATQVRASLSCLDRGRTELEIEITARSTDVTTEVSRNVTVVCLSGPPDPDPERNRSAARSRDRGHSPVERSHRPSSNRSTTVH
jgi:hypothetical protein